jgi:PIN domain nuclease of toxin-antitoxin system
MQLLLDTNALLWFLTGAARIESVRSLILSDVNDVYVSVVSWWEIAIKSRIGKLDADLPALRITAANSGLIELPLSGRHAEYLASLPLYHKDPFDHMLLSQAMSESMRFITGDSLLAQYSPLVTLI